MDFLKFNWQNHYFQRFFLLLMKHYFQGLIWELRKRLIDSTSQYLFNLLCYHVNKMGSPCFSWTLTPLRHNRVRYYPISNSQPLNPLSLFQRISIKGHNSFHLSLSEIMTNGDNSINFLSAWIAWTIRGPNTYKQELDFIFIIRGSQVSVISNTIFLFWDMGNKTFGATAKC